MERSVLQGGILEILIAEQSQRVPPRGRPQSAGIRGVPKSAQILFRPCHWRNFVLEFGLLDLII